MANQKPNDLTPQLEYSLLDIVFQNFFIFLCLNAIIGYILGFFALFAVARPLADIVRSQNWPFTREETILKLVILVVIILAVLTSAWLTSIWVKLKKGKILLVALLVGIALVVYFLLPTPASLWDKNISLGAAQYTFGPYPSDDLLEELHERKYDAVVSLLSPLVVPIEPKLILEERKKMKHSGLVLIEAPLLPWINAPQNKRSLAVINNLAKKGKGKFYIHCYLGRDRIRMAMTEVGKYSKDIRVITPGYDPKHKLEEVK